MTINFKNLPSELFDGAERAAKTLGFEIREDGTQISAIRGEEIRVDMENGKISIRYKEKNHFFRALSLVKEGLINNSFPIVESPIIDRVGAMPDLSFGAPMTPDAIKSLADYMAVMGMNTLYLYLEDMYELPSRKYFGYTSGRYTYDELKAIDDYAFDYGIEVIPCIQTLGHLNKYMQWAESADVKETDRELSVDKEESYVFIKEMLKAATAPFRSRRVHIGMDEAWGIGRGRASIANFGLRSQEELFLAHLKKVSKIAEEMGLEPIIWNDFLFCLNSKSGISKYEKETEVPKSIMAQVPKNVSLVYWHYGEEVMGCDDHMVAKNLEFGNDVIYAGGLMMWTFLLPENEFSFLAAEEGLMASKKHGLKEVFTTLWCYDKAGCDCLLSILHLQQFAEHAYHKTVSREDLKRRFEITTGADFDAFMNMSRAYNDIDGKSFANYNERFHGQKLLWNDILLGKFDDMLNSGGPFHSHYAKFEKYYAKTAAKGGKWAHVYERCRVIFDLLAKKSFITENLRRAYLSGDKKFLEECELVHLPELIEKSDALHEELRKMWESTRKPFGFATLDTRLGGMRARYVTAIRALKNYRTGITKSIPELDEERLPVPESMWT